MWWQYQRFECSYGHVEEAPKGIPWSEKRYAMTSLVFIKKKDRTAMARFRIDPMFEWIVTNAERLPAIGDLDEAGSSTSFDLSEFRKIAHDLDLTAREMNLEPVSKICSEIKNYIQEQLASVDGADAVVLIPLDVIEE